MTPRRSLINIRYIPVVELPEFVGCALIVHTDHPIIQAAHNLVVINLNLRGNKVTTYCSVFRSVYALFLMVSVLWLVHTKINLQPTGFRLVSNWLQTGKMVTLV